uniref:Uncharacterized protein n=1 Tax=Caulobacter sp. (strain K31) TaxID=366602 RepID=B0T9N9_CAUSK
MLAGQLARLRPSLVLPQDPDDLLFRKSRSLHVRPLKGRTLAPRGGKNQGQVTSNVASLINYGERYRSGERISSAFVEATVNAVVSKRFAKKQQMQWSRCGAHLLLQARTKTLDGTLRSTFERWYPGLANDNDQRLILAQTA